MKTNSDFLKLKLPGSDLSSQTVAGEQTTGKHSGETARGKKLQWTKTQIIYKNVVTNIICKTKLILDYYGRKLKQHEDSLTVEQFSLLQILKMHAPNSLNINSLRAKMQDKNSDVSRLVEKLRKKGWVEKHHNYRDRRVADVSLTKNGYELLLQLDIEEKKWPEIISGLSEEDAEKLNDMLSRISIKALRMSKAVIAVFLMLINTNYVFYNSNDIYRELI